jgi:hypothetical protein
MVRVRNGTERGEEKEEVDGGRVGYARTGGGVSIKGGRER